jgi:hypothetical protein
MQVNEKTIRIISKDASKLLGYLRMQVNVQFYIPSSQRKLHPASKTSFTRTWI